MGGCQSFIGSGDEASHTLTVENHGDINTQKLKNNNIQKAWSHCEDTHQRERVLDVDLFTLCVLPHGLDLNEWLAFNTISFFKNINLISGALSEFCTSSSCPSSTGPGNKVYEWMDEHGKKLKCSAPLYTDYAMSYIQELLTDENVFPTTAGVKFPNGFMFLVQKVYLLLFRILSHFYSAHYRDSVAVDMHIHLNTLVTHLLTFSHTFKLLEAAETAQLDDLINSHTRLNINTLAH